MRRLIGCVVVLACCSGCSTLNELLPGAVVAASPVRAGATRPSGRLAMPATGLGAATSAGGPAAGSPATSPLPPAAAGFPASAESAASAESSRSAASAAVPASDAGRGDGVVVVIAGAAAVIAVIFACNAFLLARVAAGLRRLGPGSVSAPGFRSGSGSGSGASSGSGPSAGVRSGSVSGSSSGSGLGRGFASEPASGPASGARSRRAIRLPRFAAKPLPEARPIEMLRGAHVALEGDDAEAAEAAQVEPVARLSHARIGMMREYYIVELG